MQLARLLALCGLVTASLHAHPSTFMVRYYPAEISNATAANCEIVTSEFTQQHRLAASGVHVEVHHEHLPDEGDNHKPLRTLVSVFAPEAALAWRYVRARCMQLHTPNATAAAPNQDIDIRKIVDSGPSPNRIDVVLMGDGYQLTDRNKFFADMERLTQDMFRDVTFRSYLPLFNVWGIHVPSTDAGIGVGGVPRNTPFRLYRDGTELRGIYTANPQYARDVCKMTGPNACNFPSLIGNDDFYGGLGGEFTIATRSLTSGTVVLRHEMGHNFASVGEEYDGGNVYSGANSSPSLAVKWQKWATDSTVREEAAIIRLQQYPWYDLAKGQLSFQFTSDGSYKRWYFVFTASGVQEPGSLIVELDGKSLNWQSAGTMDRSFFRYYGSEGFTSGTHTLVFRSGFPPANGAPIRQVCSMTIHEYMGEDLFHWEGSFIGAYPTWSAGGRKTYRPTNELCLMRNMTSPVFCPICKESIWLQFLARMSLIDDVVVNLNPGIDVSVKLVVVPVGQFRNPSIGLDEKLTTQWYQNGALRPELNDVFEWNSNWQTGTGNWEVVLQYVTEEVRNDPNNLLRFARKFTVA